MLHNDPFNSLFYEYANKVNSNTTSIIARYNSLLGKSGIPEVNYTLRLNHFTYRYFEKSSVYNSRNSGQSAGPYLQSLGIETRTLEIPLFLWQTLEQKSLAIQAYRAHRRGLPRVFPDAVLQNSINKEHKEMICSLLVQYFQALTSP